MQFEFTDEQRIFREEVRRFLTNEIRPEWEADLLDETTDEGLAIQRSFTRKLAARGWLVVGWPREYGGQGRGYIEQAILNEEKAYWRAPELYSVGPGPGSALLVFGTEEQKKRYLPPIARGEAVYWEGFTEPNAGSDLASLQTRAIRDGDEYRIEGQKVFIGSGGKPDFIYLAARTVPSAPKHRGISLFIVDAKSPGVTIRRLPVLGGHTKNEVFFDSVRVPADAMVGEENRGWYHIGTAMAFERSAIFRLAAPKRIFDDLVVYVAEVKQDGQASAGNSVLRHKLAELAIEFEVGRWFAYRVAWMQSKGLVPPYEASMSKVYATELGQRLASTGMQALELYGLLTEGSRNVVLKGRLEALYRSAVSDTIRGGTSEIQRNIIATRGLGLPRQ